MKTLLLDSSSKYLSLAIADDERIIARVHTPLDRKHSARLVNSIERLLSSQGIALNEIQGFGVGKGPGSFTGLRIGITTIKGLAFATKKPIVAIASLDIIACAAYKLITPRGKNKRIWVLIDAKQKKVYAACYLLDNGKLRRSGKYFLLPFEQIVNKMEGEAVFIGDGIALYREMILNNKKIKATFANESFWYPRIEYAHALFKEAFKKKAYSDVLSLTPLYLYQKTCQIKKSKRMRR